MLTCSKCNAEKPDEDFYPSRDTRGRREKTYWCKACYAAHYLENRERQLLTNQRARIRRRYGLDLEEYNRLVAQGCSVCGETEKRIVMDHNHVTDAIRAPLCDGCNLALGGAGDDPNRLRALASYLESHARPVAPPATLS